MLNYKYAKDLFRDAWQGARLLDCILHNDGRPVEYGQAVELLGGDETKIERMLAYGTIESTSEGLELSELYRSFLEKALAINEDITVTEINTFMSDLNLAVEDVRTAGNDHRKNRAERKLRSIFRDIDNTTGRNVADLKRNVDNTYKQETDLARKYRRLENFDRKMNYIIELVDHIERYVRDNPLAFTAHMLCEDTRNTVRDALDGVTKSSRTLLSIQKQIIEYLGIIKYKDKVAKKISKLKYLKDQLQTDSRTDIREISENLTEEWLENRPRYMTAVPLDWLESDDAVPVITSVAKRESAGLKAQSAGPIEEERLNALPEEMMEFDTDTILTEFLAQRLDLFSFLMKYGFRTEVATDERVDLFVKIVTGHPDKLSFSDEYMVTDGWEYAIITPR